MKDETQTCRICGNLLAGQTVIRIESGRTPICAQCWQDWSDMSRDISDQIDEIEAGRDDEYKSRWDTD